MKRKAMLVMLIFTVLMFCTGEAIANDLIIANEWFYEYTCSVCGKVLKISEEEDGPPDSGGCPVSTSGLHDWQMTSADQEYPDEIFPGVSGCGSTGVGAAITLLFMLGPALTASRKKRDKN
jgi:hypothetical protein